MPKYIGPYKLIKDFGNQSFRVDLSGNREGSMTHSTQHDEWAVDKILSHAGSDEKAVFEVKWKAGDVTWLPFSHVEHLYAWRPIWSY